MLIPLEARPRTIRAQQAICISQDLLGQVCNPNPNDSSTIKLTTFTRMAQVHSEQQHRQNANGTPGTAASSELAAFVDCAKSCPGATGHITVWAWSPCSHHLTWRESGRAARSLTPATSDFGLTMRPNTGIGIKRFTAGQPEMAVGPRGCRDQLRQVCRSPSSSSGGGNLGRHPADMPAAREMTATIV
jgi:hypothetical protein